MDHDQENARLSQRNAELRRALLDAYGQLLHGETPAHTRNALEIIRAAIRADDEAEWECIPVPAISSIA